MQLQPYLTFNGTCEDALNFYKAVFNGEIIDISRFGETPMEFGEEDKNRVMNAIFKAGDIAFMASDTMPGQGTPTNGNITMALVTTDLEATDRTFAALAEDGTITMPLDNTFWNARFGMLIDKFGIEWMINCDLPAAE